MSRKNELSTRFIPALAVFVVIGYIIAMESMEFALMSAGALFIAVFLACTVEAVEATTIVLAAGLARGILVSKSAGGVSAGIQPATGLESWAAWTLTEYGIQFASMAKLVGSGPMLVW